DEATSAIDSVTEEAVQHGIMKLTEGRTSFIVAHRLSTVRNADRILFIDGGRIVEEGSHEELMAKHGRYCSLCTSQGLCNQR
ncbi:MAG: ABC transporter ATP-binding protein, partial [Candidatus Ornithospirochaeta sp.]|nr:ABC transporter ATP-binding protein [Candidatus Ornithospirochaeta sp.]